VGGIFPVEWATGGYTLYAGPGEWDGDDDHANSVHGMATDAYRT